MEIDFLAKSHLAFCGAALEHQAKQLELAFAWVSIYPIKCKDKRERERGGERGERQRERAREGERERERARQKES